MNPATPFSNGPSTWKPSAPRFRAARLVPWVVLWSVATVGCYRATGIQRPPALASEIPAIGGDRVHGLKAQAGPGDYFLGNDYLELAVDGSILGERDAIGGASAGGSIVDVGYVGLDTSFHRVSVPSDMIERLTPVVNQDPDLPLVFDRYRPVNESGESRIEMTGYIHDRLHKLSGASWDAQDLVRGVTVTHVVTLGKNDRFFKLSTTVANAAGVALPLRNIADYLQQQGGGFRVIVPATHDLNGSPVSGWGAEIPAPGANWSAPLDSAVKAHLVALVGTEPGADSLDSHIALGLLPVDSDQVAVSADPQASLSEYRPRFSARMAAGSLPVASLPAGQSLSYNRRLYVTGGTTLGSNQPNQSSGIVNSLEFERSVLRNWDYGVVTFSTFGTAARTGPLPVEVRWERDLGGGSWQLERVDWMEPAELQQFSVQSGSSTGAILRTGTYRIQVRNRDRALVMNLFTDVLSTDRPDLATPLLVAKDKNFYISESLAPERDLVLTASGSVNTLLFSQHQLSARERDGEDGMFQPLRFTVTGTGGTAAPDIRRIRSLGGQFDPYSKAKAIAGINQGAYQFVAGNSVFGATFAAATPGICFLPKGSYEILATRGPQSRLDRTPVQAFDGQVLTSHSHIVFPSPLPSTWTSFDLPGPSQITLGGYLPAERLASALAENVQVVGAAEVDLHIDADNQYNDFRMEFSTSLNTDAQRTAILNDPFVVGGRTSTLVDASQRPWGTVTALWVPAATAERNRGALSSRSWGLADFLTQAQGKYSVVHRPRGPQGLFTLRGFDPAVALGSGVNAWWNQSGPLSIGATHGGFDGLELLRAEGFDPAAPNAWFTEFKTVRRDWFALLNQQRPTAFTKGLGLSAARYSLDTPVGLARTYLKIGGATLSQSSLGEVLNALKSGAAVASTGPLLDVTLAGVGPGGLATASGTASLSVHLYATDWMPVDEVRIVVNGQVVQTLDPATFASGSDWRQRSATVPVQLPGKDCWIVVEAGVPLATTGVYRAGTPWNQIQKGIYPIAVTNPIFVDVTGGGYTPPGI